jgi:hypothetical protein
MTYKKMVVFSLLITIGFSSNMACNEYSFLLNNLVWVKLLQPEKPSKIQWLMMPVGLIFLLWYLKEKIQREWNIFTVEYHWCKLTVLISSLQVHSGNFKRRICYRRVKMYIQNQSKCIISSSDDFCDISCCIDRCVYIKYKCKYFTIGANPQSQI